MTTPQAIHILKLYLRWRRGVTTDCPVSQTEIREAIELAVREMNRTIKEQNKRNK